MTEPLDDRETGGEAGVPIPLSSIYDIAAWTCPAMKQGSSMN